MLGFDVADNRKPLRPTFVDLFSGCGGLSLGLLSAGWQGLFAVEKNPDAFSTLYHNLVEEGFHNYGQPKFNWPTWLCVEPQPVARILRKHQDQLHALSGRVTLVAGGPPCQGFSFAGKRTGKDRRNELFKQHLQVVDILRPDLVLLENVRGIRTVFGATKRRKSPTRGRPRKSYAQRIGALLCKRGYRFQQHLLRACDFGVPQLRPRYFALGIREDVVHDGPTPDLAEVLTRQREAFLDARHLPTDRPVTVSEAISDMVTENGELIPCDDIDSSSGHLQVAYQLGPQTTYQRLLHGDMNGCAPNSLRLANHRPDTVARFGEILDTCRKGIELSAADRNRLGISKKALTPLHPDQPSHYMSLLASSCPRGLDPPGPLQVRQRDALDGLSRFVSADDPVGAPLHHVVNSPAPSTDVGANRLLGRHGVMTQLDACREALPLEFYDRWDADVMTSMHENPLVSQIEHWCVDVWQGLQGALESAASHQAAEAHWALGRWSSNYLVHLGALIEGRTSFSAELDEFDELLTLVRVPAKSRSIRDKRRIHSLNAHLEVLFFAVSGDSPTDPQSVRLSDVLVLEGQWVADKLRPRIGAADDSGSASLTIRFQGNETATLTAPMFVWLRRRAAGRLDCRCFPPDLLAGASDARVRAAAKSKYAFQPNDVELVVSTEQGIRYHLTRIDSEVDVTT